MKMTNGNRKFLRVLYQNIPGTLSHVNKITTIQSLLNREEPDILAIAEPRTSDLDIDWQNYTLVPGHINHGKNVLH